MNLMNLLLKIVNTAKYVMISNTLLRIVTIKIVKTFVKILKNTKIANVILNIQNLKENIRTQVFELQQELLIKYNSDLKMYTNFMTKISIILF